MGTLCDSSKCGDPIYWLENDNTHRRAPIQAVPLEGGNVTVDLAHGTYHVLTKSEMASPSLFGDDGARHWPHFALCRDVATYVRRCGSCHEFNCDGSRPSCGTWRCDLQTENDERRIKLGLDA